MTKFNVGDKVEFIEEAVREADRLDKDEFGGMKGYAGGIIRKGGLEKGGVIERTDYSDTEAPIQVAIPGEYDKAWAEPEWLKTPDKFQPGDVVDWVTDSEPAREYWAKSVVVQRKDFRYSMEDDKEAYQVRNPFGAGIGLIHASELVLHEDDYDEWKANDSADYYHSGDDEDAPDLRFHEYVEPEVDEVQDDGLWKALNLMPNPRPSMFFIKHMPGDNPDAPTIEELSQAQDISGYATSFEFTLGEWQEPEEDLVSAPKHYSEGMPEGIEVRDIIKAQGFWKEFCAGNVIKYSLRWQYKNGIEDLKKMLQYGQWLVEELEAEDA